MLKKMLKIFFGLVVVGWLGFCLAVYCFPQWFFYYPSSHQASINNAHANSFPAEEVSYQSADGTNLYGWYVKPKTKDKVIVFYHGNAFNIEAFYHKLIPLVEAGYGAFIGEYRGFGGIKGKIRQDNIAADANAAINYLHSLGYKNNDLIIYGMSLGSYAAVNTAYQLGQDQQFESLILEVPFDSVLEVVKQRIIPLFPFGLLVKDRYDNLDKIKQIKTPVLIMAASDDLIVPPERAQVLFRQANEPKKMIVYPGAGHSELYNYRNWRDILKWLEHNEEIK